MATFKCNQQRKPAKSWRADKLPRGAAPGPPPRHGTHPQHYAGTQGTREKVIKYQGLQKELKRLRRHSHTCWHGLEASQTNSSYSGSWRSTARKASMATCPENKEEGLFWLLAVHR